LPGKAVIFLLLLPCFGGTAVCLLGGASGMFQAKPLGFLLLRLTFPALLFALTLKGAGMLAGERSLLPISAVAFGDTGAELAPGLTPFALAFADAEEEHAYHGQGKDHGRNHEWRGNPRREVEIVREGIHHPHRPSREVQGHAFMKEPQHGTSSFTRLGP
jgi:hypothetical protein